MDGSNENWVPVSPHTTKSLSTDILNYIKSNYNTTKKNKKKNKTWLTVLQCSAEDGFSGVATRNDIEKKNFDLLFTLNAKGAP